jgi:1,5-anhydro-D-fructose reductase (1,5-anhydro-D-mannitol-forming)
MTAPVGLGIMGCGWAAGEIVRAAAGLGSIRIVATCDADPARAADYARRAGARPVADLDAMLADPAVTAVYVGLPHHLLAGVTERCLAAGRHVLCEKPLALDPAEARRLGDAAARAGLKLAVFFELRRAGTVEAARRLVGEGAIGEPRLIRVRTLIDKPLAYWGPPGAPNWRASKAAAGGGVVLMNTIHQLDSLRYITGLDFVRASGSVATFTAPAEVEDSASATIALSNGALLNLVAGAHVPGAEEGESIEIDGTGGRLDIPSAWSRLPLRLYSSAEKSWRDVAVERVDSHLLMIESFLEAIRTGGPVPASAFDAAAAVATVQAIYRSSAEGRAVGIG